MQKTLSPRRSLWTWTLWCWRCCRKLGGWPNWVWACQRSSRRWPPERRSSEIWTGGENSCCSGLSVNRVSFFDVHVFNWIDQINVLLFWFTLSGFVFCLLSFSLYSLTVFGSWEWKRGTLPLFKLHLNVILTRFPSPLRWLLFSSRHHTSLTCVLLQRAGLPEWTKVSFHKPSDWWADSSHLWTLKHTKHWACGGACTVRTCSSTYQLYTVLKISIHLMLLILSNRLIVAIIKHSTLYTLLYCLCLHCYRVQSFVCIVYLCTLESRSAMHSRCKVWMTMKFTLTRLAVDLTLPPPGCWSCSRTWASWWAGSHLSSSLSCSSSLAAWRQLCPLDSPHCPGLLWILMAVRTDSSCLIACCINVQIWRSVNKAFINDSLLLCVLLYSVIENVSVALKDLHLVAKMATDLLECRIGRLLQAMSSCCLTLLPEDSPVSPQDLLLQTKSSVQAAAVTLKW